MLLHASHVITFVIPAAPGRMRSLRQVRCLFFPVYCPQAPSTALGGVGGRADQQICTCWAVKEMIEGVVGEEPGQALQKILSWGFPPSGTGNILFPLPNSHKRASPTFPEEEGILHYSHHGAGYHKPCQTNLIQLALWLGGWGEGNERNPQLSTTSTPTTRECALLPGVLWFKEVRPTLSLHVADRAARACLLPEELAGPLHESNS